MKAMRPLIVPLALVLVVFPAAAHEIHDAARAGDLEKIRTLLAAHPEWLEIRTETQKTPLHFAAEGGNVDVIRFLLDQGAAVNAKNISGETPLHYATGWCHVEAVKLLLERKADVHSKTDEGDTPLHYLRFVGRAEVARLLLDSGADLDARNNSGQTFLGMAVASGRPQLIDLALDSGAVIAPEEGMRILVDAAEAGNLSLVDRILDQDIRAEAEGEEGARLLHAAAAGGHKSLVDDLLSRGGDLRSESSSGGTLLHSAARSGLVDLGAKVIAQGVDLDARDDYGRTALHISQDWGNQTFAALLRQAGAPSHPREVIWLSDPVEDSESFISLEISYIANEGFMIATPRKTVLVDALIQNPWGYLNTPAQAYAKMKDSAAPFAKLDLLLFSHAHRDHFEPSMALELMASHRDIHLVGNSVTVGELEQAAGSKWAAIKSRIHDLNPQWGTVLAPTVSGIKMKVFPVNHGDPSRPYVTLAYIMYLDGITVLHLGDIHPMANVDHFPKFDLAKESIDIAFIDPFFLQNEAGRKILADHLRPLKIILMHMRPNEVDRYAQEIGRDHDNLLVFHEPMEKKSFRKAAAPKQPASGC